MGWVAGAESAKPRVDAVLLWVAFGLTVGALAMFVMPAEEHGGILLAVLLGTAGAFAGGLLSTFVLCFGGLTGFDLRTTAIAGAGALLVLGVHGLFSRRRE